MPEGIRPRVNEAREFIEIAKDFKDPKEIIREALSNSWDAGASKVSLKFDLVRIPGTARKKILVEIADDGEGMSCVKREGAGTSEIEDFFNLGDSHKPFGSIGTKGHGAKIYYKSNGIIFDTWKNGHHVHAETEVPPWETLKKGIVPTYRYDEDAIDGKGTRIIVDGFEGKQSEFASVNELLSYILWYTVAGSFGQYFNNPRKIDVDLQPIGFPTRIPIPFGFKFPNEDVDLSNGADHYCKIFGPRTVECGTTSDGTTVTVNMIGAILGEANRGSVPHTYEMMGLWLCKDFLRVERNNFIMEKAFKGQYWYRNMLVFANCQQFDLTANRNNIRNDQEEYDLAIDGISKFLETIKSDSATTSYFESKQKEEEAKQHNKQREADEKRKDEAKNVLAKRLNEYKGRPDLRAPSLRGAPIKEPKSEAETALLLQSMISCGDPAIDFRIGEYKTSQGTDLLIEYTSKGIPGYAWAEIVVTLENLFAWSHPPEGIHKVICWRLGDVKQEQAFQDGKVAKLVKKNNGRYHLDVGTDSIEVYVLQDLV
ncbi:MAG: hypothetical protein Q7K03_07880 [Dehalococcoidia bacterium]|nr:hypothetical protein [Dehalococcoidia bacterium]